MNFDPDEIDGVYDYDAVEHFASDVARALERVQPGAEHSDSRLINEINTYLQRRAEL